MGYDIDGHPSSQCEGKEKYATSALANMVVKRRRAKQGSRLGAYHCHHCGSWHVGNKPAKRDLNHRRDEARRAVL